MYTSVYTKGRVEGKKSGGRPGLTWMNGVIEWTGLETCENLEGTAGDGEEWGAVVVDLL